VGSSNWQVVCATQCRRRDDHKPSRNDENEIFKSLIAIDVKTLCKPITGDPKLTHSRLLYSDTKCEQSA